MVNGGTVVYKYYLIALFVIILDQLTKWGVVKNMTQGQEIVIWDPIFSLYSHRNQGAAWGMMQGKLGLFTIITLVVIVAIIYFFHKESKGRPLFSTSLMLLLGGAIGNFIDRLTRGEVVDFASFWIPVIDYDFPIFNIADVSLTFGVILMIVYVLFFEGKAGKVKK